MADSVGGINNINFNIGSGNLANTAKPILTAARSVQGMSKKNSISAMAKDLIMQYPVYFDSAIDTDDMVKIVKADERMYAAMQLAIWSADTAFGVDPTSSGGVRDFVRKYHLNEDSPDMVSYAGNLTRNISAYRGSYSAHADPPAALESALFDEDVVDAEIVHVTSAPQIVSKEHLATLWDTFEESITMESVNDVYNPTEQTVGKLLKATAALEAAGDNSFRDRYNAAQTNGYKANDFQGRTKEQMENDIKRDLRSLNNAAIINDKKLSSLEPTMLSVEFFVRNPSGGGKVTKALIGIKAQPRIIRSDAMASNVIGALQGNHAAFQFVKWTRGETKLVRDLIFNVSQIKQDAITKDRFAAYFGSMRKRKDAFKTFKFGDTTVNPYTTIVISVDTVERIKQAAGYDLSDIQTCKRFMDALFLLGVQIVDPATGLIHTCLDAWDNFATTTVRSLAAGAKDDKLDYADIGEVIRILGRPGMR